MRLSTELKIRIVLLYAKLESVSMVQTALKAEKVKEIPTPKTIRSIYKKFCETGSVDELPRSGRPKIYEENEVSEVKALIEENPKSTLSEISSISGASRSTVFNILHSDLSLKSYKIEIHQKLFEEDFDRRVQTAQDLLPYLNDPSFNKFIFFSDEATFHVSGYVHKQNCRIWSTDKPTEVYEYQDNTPKVNVWCAMSAECMIGPYFFEENVNASNYLDMLENFFWPIVKNKRIASKIMFQQDGAAAHYSLIVRDWLDKRLPGRWIGRRGPIEWAARAPDLTPCDFFLWGYVKQKVYQKYHKNLAELRESIANVIKSITPDVLEHVFANLQKRLEKVIENNGAHIEQYL